VKLRVCEECGRPFEPQRARQRRCPAHEVRGRDGASPTTRAQDAEYAAERARLLTPGARCYWCGDPATTVDHLRPVAHGGRHRGNLVACCAPCNASRQAGEAPRLRQRASGAAAIPVPADQRVVLDELHRHDSTTVYRPLLPS
jgi:hypothetical protein